MRPPARIQRPDRGRDRRRQLPRDARTRHHRLHAEARGRRRRCRRCRIVAATGIVVHDDRDRATVAARTQRAQHEVRARRVLEHHAVRGRNLRRRRLLLDLRARESDRDRLAHQRDRRRIAPDARDARDAREQIRGGGAHAVPRKGRYVSRMLSPSPDVRGEIADAVAAYQSSANVAQLLARLQEIAAQAPTADALAEAAEPYREIPEVAGPLYERIVAERPNDARALVILASAYWLAGRGPEVVGELASRAIAADPANRAAWHLWALTEPAPRQRVSRWQ